MREKTKLSAPRGFLNSVSNAASAVGNAASNAVSAVVNTVSNVANAASDTFTKTEVVVPETPMSQKSKSLRDVLRNEIFDNVCKNNQASDEERQKFIEEFDKADSFGKRVLISMNSSSPNEMNALRKICEEIDTALAAREKNYKETDPSVWSNPEATRAKNASEDEKLFNSTKTAINESKDSLFSMPNILMKLIIYITQGQAGLDARKENARLHSVVEDHEKSIDLSGPK